MERNPNTITYAGNILTSSPLHARIKHRMSQIEVRQPRLQFSDASHVAGYVQDNTLPEDRVVLAVVDGDSIAELSDAVTNTRRICAEKHPPVALVVIDATTTHALTGADYIIAPDDTDAVYRTMARHFGLPQE